MLMSLYKHYDTVAIVISLIYFGRLLSDSVMAYQLEQTGAIKILLFLLKEGPTHKYGIHKGSNVELRTMSNALKVLTESGLITQVIERRGIRKSVTHVQKLTLEGHQIADHLQEIDKIMTKKTLNITK